MSHPSFSTRGRGFLRRTARERIVLFLKTYEWPLLLALWAISLWLGYWGFSIYHAQSPEPRYCLDKLYLALQLFTFESGSVAGDKVSWQLQVARLLSPAAMLYTAFAALALIFREQVERVRIRFMSGHTVVSGLGRRGVIVTQSLLDRGKTVIAIEQDPGNDAIPQVREKGCIVLIGNASDPEVLRKGRVHTAGMLISVCSDDGINAEVAVDARDLSTGRRGDPLRCIVQINDIDLCHLLMGQELALGRNGSFRLEFFNTYVRGARAVLEEHPPFREQETDPHLLVVGMGRLGQSIVVHAARAWRNRRPSEHTPLRVTLIDKRPEDKLSLLIMRTPMIETICDLKPLLMDVQSAEFHRAEFLFDAQGARNVTAVYVCLDDDARALAAGLVLLRHLRRYDVPIVVRLARDDGLARLIKGADGSHDGFGNLQAFGFVERTCDPDLILGGTNELLARSLHKEYRTSRLTLGVGPDKDRAVVEWELLPEKIKDACRANADQICLALMAGGCTIEPLSRLDAEMFLFDADQEETVAGSLYELLLEDHRAGRHTYSMLSPLLETAHSNRTRSWDEVPAEMKETYRDVVRFLPSFLARVDMQIFAHGGYARSE
ncbi:MAG: NAD-binding protein [Thermodesulfobacteriota bacterium]